MRKALERLIAGALARLDLAVARRSTFERLRENEALGNDIDFLLALPAGQARQLLENLRASKSQIRQDLFVLSELGFKRNGYFVEFGATDGVAGSNTHLLEKSFGWTGILAEPARCWHDALRANRGAHIETRCVWSESGAVLEFNEVREPALSTIRAFSALDMYRHDRKAGRTYEVATVSLDDLLEAHGAPPEIDYLSIDTEGSEFEILRHFDFGRRRFRVITCEHNFTPLRERIFELLSAQGYVRKYQEFSQVDDWYVRPA